jgi:hypothetical protein
MARTPKGKIQKGKFLEKFVAHAIEEAGLGMACREIGSGSGKRKGDIFGNLPFLFEVKNEESPKWMQNIKQAKRQAEQGNWAREKWVLVQRNPESPQSNPELFVVIDLYEFLKLLKKDSEPIIKEPDHEMKWLLQKLVETCKQVEKRLE